MNTRQVVKLSGATARQLQWWDEWGIVRPTHYGHQRYYTAAQVTSCMVIMDLKRKGIQLRNTKAAVAAIADSEMANYLVVTDKGKAWAELDEMAACKRAAAHRGPVCVLPIRRHYQEEPVPTLKKFLPKQPRPKRTIPAPNRVGGLTRYERFMTASALCTRGVSVTHRQDYTDADIEPGRRQEAEFLRGAMKTRSRMPIDGVE